MLRIDNLYMDKIRYVNLFIGDLSNCPKNTYPLPLRVVLDRYYTCE